MTSDGAATSARRRLSSAPRRRGGSVAAFERLYRQLSPSVASYLRWNGVTDVESLTNEVMAQVHRNLARFSGDGAAFRSWVFTIAHHRMVDDRRARSRRPVMGEPRCWRPRSWADVEDDALAALSDHRLLAAAGSAVAGPA